MKKGESAIEMLVNKYLEMLAKGIVPWRRPWKLGELPTNLISKKPYRGINLWYLMATIMNQNYSRPFFLTKTQALTRWGYKYDSKSKTWTWDRKSQEPVELDLLGKGLVKKDEKAHIVVYWKWFKFKEKDDSGQETGRTKTYPKVFFYWVYNVDQLNLPEGAIPEPVQGKVWNEQDQNESAERIITEYVSAKRGGPKYSETQSDRAFYSPTYDKVVVPKREQYGHMAEFYTTAFHELCHSTGHGSRLKRKEVTDTAFFGSHSYSSEELVAEMGAALLASECGFQEQVVENSAAYIAAWMNRLSNDKNLLWQAAQRAQKAVDYILDRKPEEAKEEADGSEKVPATA